ncbi:FtsX-like permease family protein [Streptomyces sp. 549]|uniref:ABC transporter permease n=1 Tax=Streptomyces sp. 549 TaxID=3049076 RepID=UPI0024C37CEB|nr:FtsX-like permease family protein [Streptomyces sp. 549]MDK1475986.1 FtsX-like permease family protein [Streptomyces sp. 549]
MTVVRTSLRNFFAHKGRMLLSGFAVVLSVAFVCGTLVFTDTMNTTFDKLFADSSADVTVSAPEEEGHNAEQPMTGRPQTLPADVVDEVAAADGVGKAFGLTVSLSVTVVDAENNNVGPTTGAPTVASNWTDLDLKTMKVTSGHPPRGPTEVMVDADTADKKNLKLGDELRTITTDGDFTSRISGIATFQMTNPGAAVLYYDERTAQEKLLGSSGVYTHVAVLAADGVTDDLLKRNVSEAIGGDWKVQTKEEFSAEGMNDIGGFLDVMKYALLGFAGIALLVGVFLIVNTFSMLVAQRTREIGLMRAIGAGRGQVNRSVLIEALLLGLIGSALGVGAGVGLAVGLMELMGLVGMNLSTDDLTIAWTTPVVGVVLGVLVTVLAAYLPARRAGRVPPMAALRDAGTSSDGSAGWVRGVIGGVLTLAGAGALFAVTRSEEAGPGSMLLGLGIVLTLVGFILIGPLLSQLVVKGLSLVVLRMWGPVGRLAERNALRNPRRTGATGAALMIGLALVAGLSVVGSSLVASASDELDKSVGADFIVAGDTMQPITPQVADALKETPGLAHVTEYRWFQGVKLSLPADAKETVDLVAASPSYAEDVRVETVEGALADAYRPDSFSVHEDFAKEHGLSVGDTVGVGFPGGEPAQLTVGAITTSSSSLEGGAMFTSIDTAAKYVPDDRMPLNVMMFGKAEEGQEEAAYAALKAELEPYPQYTVRDQADYKQLLQDQIGGLLNMVYGLLALAIVVAVLGVVNTLALSVVERTREIGLIRAIGLSRRQLRRMIRLESVVIALFGALLGLGLGMGWGTAAQQLLALEGFTTLEIPWPTILTVFAGSALVGLVAALVPAFRAGRMNVLNAIATE